MRSLRGRIALTLVVFGLATLIAIAALAVSYTHLTLPTTERV